MTRQSPPIVPERGVPLTAETVVVPVAVLNEAAGILDCEGYGPLSMSLLSCLSDPAREPEGGAVEAEHRRLLEAKIEHWTGADYLGDDRLEVDDALELADAIKAILAALTPKEAPASEGAA